MKAVDITSHVKATKIIGTGNEKIAMLIVSDKSVKAFNEAVVAESDIRRTRRWSAERDLDNAIKNHVRWVADFHGKHLTNIVVVAATDKPDLVRTAAGRFMKI
jgi:hypothetical protein